MLVATHKGLTLSFPMWDFDVWMGTGHGMLGVSDIVTRLMMMIDELAYVAYRQFPRSSFIVIYIKFRWAAIL